MYSGGAMRAQQQGPDSSSDDTLYDSHPLYTHPLSRAGTSRSTGIGEDTTDSSFSYTESRSSGKEEVPTEPQEVLHEQKAQASDTEALQEPTDLFSLSDTVGEQMPRIERPQRQAPVQRAMPEPDQSSIADTKQERTAMYYHSLEEVTTAPGFDRTLLASRIIYPESGQAAGKGGPCHAETVHLIARTGSNGVIVEQDPGYGFAEAAVRAVRGLTGESLP